MTKKHKGHRKMMIQISRAKRRLENFEKSRNISQIEVELKKRYEENQKEANKEAKHQ